ncbi:hypothetical protein DICVIV_00914 [Dictyocaulus viviparus]|uniref:Small RNA 2'-O-methyltransferase n=1 Tax=Dictyocaulus viviparus TaxID=29172 RepID=A0A0D8YA60_DICVI|nr:hypothetical protein DICVIV_00914 [Dictyocaulus viviparus]
MIYEEVEANPIEIKVEEAPFSQFDYDEVVSKPRFFTPPLQYQRNLFVRDIINSHMEGTGKKIRKLAVLGCGSLSLERFLMSSLGDMGIERVLSVDIDEHELAKGIKLLKIEHIPLADATRFARSVLLNIQPDLFIVSTPNHEYNEAFGLPNGHFRHGDHKFEFSRQEFRNWLFKIVGEFTPTYGYLVKFVGKVPGFDRLGGATQFGIIHKKRARLSGVVRHECSKVYRKVGETVVRNSLFSLEREKVKQAFRLWLQENKLLEENLIQSSIGNFWRVDMKEIVRNIELPTKLKNNLNKRSMVDMLRFICRGRVINEVYNGEFCLNIPHTVTKDELIEITSTTN